MELPRSSSSQLPYCKAKGRARNYTDATTEPVDSDSDAEAAMEALDEQIAQGSAASKKEADASEGFVKLFFDKAEFKSSTMLRITTRTTAKQVREIAIQKAAHLNDCDLAFTVLMVVFLHDKSKKRVRTVEDHEAVLELQRESEATMPATKTLIDALKVSRQSPNGSIKFILKDRRLSPLNIERELGIEAEFGRKRRLLQPNSLGRGIRNGYLRKQSRKDANVWRNRWFVLRPNSLFYCKSWDEQQSMTKIPLKDARVSRVSAQVLNGGILKLSTPTRSYILIAETEAKALEWHRVLQNQIRLAVENFHFYNCETKMLEETRSNSNRLAAAAGSNHPPLLTILRYPTFHGIFKSFMMTREDLNLFLAWAQCERFRACCLQECRGDHRRRNQKPCVPQQQWAVARAILDNTLPTIRRFVEFDEAYLVDLRCAIQTQLRKHRLNLALMVSADGETQSLAFPPPDFLARVQDKVYDALEKGPFQEFIGSSVHYCQLLRATIGR